MLRMSKKKFESLSLGKKILIVIIATIVFVFEKFLEKLKAINWKKIGDDIGMMLSGIAILILVWGVWSYINVTANNNVSPELINKYNLFVVLTDIFKS